MRRLLLAAVAIWPTLAMAQTFQPREEQETNYPDHPGREETFGFCGACHGFAIVAAQGLTRPQWEESLRWMTQRHNMPDLDEADRNLVLDYLAKAFPPKTRPGWRNPFSN